MTNIRQLRSQATKLIKAGTEAYAERVSGKQKTTVTTKDHRTGKVTKRTVRRRSNDKWEHLTIYEEARDLLLKHGYEEELNPKVQALYQQLIPDSPEFLAEKKTSLKRIRSRQLAQRLQAAKHIDHESRMEVNRTRALWLRHPETVETLIAARQEETDARVACYIIRALGWIYTRYFKDLRVPLELFALYDSPERSIRDGAVAATSFFKHREKWPRLLELLQDSPRKALLLSICHHVRDETPVAFKRKLQPLLIENWKRNLVQYDLLDAMVKTVDKRTVDVFKELIADNKPLTKALTSFADGAIRERREFLKTELLGIQPKQIDQKDAAKRIEELVLRALDDDAKTLRTMMTRRLKSDPDSPEVLTARAWARYKLNDYHAAKGDATKAIELCPKSYLPWYVRGACYFSTCHIRNVERDLTKAIELSRGSKLPPGGRLFLAAKSLLGDAHRMRGGIRCDDGRLDDALKDLNRAIKIDAADACAFLYRGNVYYHQQKFRMALKNYEKARSLNDKDPHAAAAIAWLLATCRDDKFRDGQGAMAHAEFAFQCDKNGFAEHLAAACAECGDFQGAVDAQKRALRNCHDWDKKQLLQKRLKLFRAGRPYRD